MICARCEESRPASRDDPDFCQECFDAVEHARASVMARARAARGWFDHSAQASAKSRVAAFLSIFHPEMSDRRRRQILAAVEEG